MKSLKSQHHELAESINQLRILNCPARPSASVPPFEERLAEVGLSPLRPTRIEVLQVNLGKMCNQTCVHCHVDAGPDRREIMTRETLEHCLQALRESEIPKVDLTGGAPEMNPHFEWFVEQVWTLRRKIMVRSNLTILTVNDHYRQLPRFFADHKITVIASLPCYTAANTDQQRGGGVFERSIEALRSLNSVGYGYPQTGLELHLVYNPLGAFLPPPQEKLARDYHHRLKDDFDLVFNELYTITNMPISRFLNHLLETGQYQAYMDKLSAAFNPSAAAGVMCRNTLSVGWDGNLYDCDFNQMLELRLERRAPQHIRDFDLETLRRRLIVLNQHCYGCTAGAGSSCGGEIVK